jgi:hypothetical protein
MGGQYSVIESEKKVLKLKKLIGKIADGEVSVFRNPDKPEQIRVVSREQVEKLHEKAVNKVTDLLENEL